MQSKKRKLLSTLIVLAMVLSLFAAIPLTASAADEPVISFDGGGPLAITGTTARSWHIIDDAGPAGACSIFGVVYLRSAAHPDAAAIKAGTGAVASASWPNQATGRTTNLFYEGLTPATNYTVYVVAENTIGFSTILSMDFTTTAASNNAGILGIASAAPVFGAEAGTIGAPKTASFTVTNIWSFIGGGQINAATGATVTTYTDSGFTTAGSVTLNVGVPTHVYIKVVAEDGTTTLYYDVTVTRQAAGTAPTITGPTTMTLTVGYAAASTNAYTIGGTAPVVVTKTSGNAAITWNDTTKKLDIAAGLAAGSYPVVLTASNGTLPNATLNPDFDTCIFIVPA